MNDSTLFNTKLNLIYNSILIRQKNKITDNEESAKNIYLSFILSAVNGIYAYEDPEEGLSFDLKFNDSEVYDITIVPKLHYCYSKQANNESTNQMATIINHSDLTSLIQESYANNTFVIGLDNVFVSIDPIV